MGRPVDWAECLAYGKSVQDWPAFEDSASALSQAVLQARRSLQCRQCKLCPQQSKTLIDFDAVYTAEDIGSYKPSQRNFEYMLANLKRLDIEKGDILHTAESMFHDHAPANICGLNNCWIYRRHDKEGFGATLHRRYAELRQSVQEHGRSSSASSGAQSA